MSSRGEIDPELATFLNEIADRIERGQTKRDARNQACGRDGSWRRRRREFKVHRHRRGPRPLGPHGVDRDLELARLVRAYKEEHPDSTFDDAYLALQSAHGVGAGTIENAWHKMGPLLDRPEVDR